MHARNISLGSAIARIGAICLIIALLAVTLLFIAMASGAATLMLVIGGYVLAFLIGFCSMVIVAYLNSPDTKLPLMQKLLVNMAAILVLLLPVMAGMAGHAYACSRLMDMSDTLLAISLALFLLAFLVGTRASFIRTRSLLHDES